MNPDCPACTAKRLHTAEDWKHHPHAGHGYTHGVGWSLAELEPGKEKPCTEETATA